MVQISCSPSLADFFSDEKSNSGHEMKYHFDEHNDRDERDEHDMNMLHALFCLLRLVLSAPPVLLFMFCTFSFVLSFLLLIALSARTLKGLTLREGQVQKN